VQTPARKYSRTRASSTVVDRLFDGRIDTAALVMDELTIAAVNVTRYIGEYWTAKQRQASSLHEISYRACFKPQLPRFFIDMLTQPGDTVYDPFMGRGTTIVEGALSGRRVIGNDLNPLSKVLTEPRLEPPTYDEVEQRLNRLDLQYRSIGGLDLSMFYHPRTRREILALRRYLARRASSGTEDNVDRWIRMVATNRLTGHSRGFFSVYTLPPNQAASQENQKRINKVRRQKPEYRDVKTLILRKSASLLRNVSEDQIERVIKAGKSARLLTGRAWQTKRIASEKVDLVVTSPPFLDTVNYAQDNWLRCWFNAIDLRTVEQQLTVVRTVDAWTDAMERVFVELFRLVRERGVVAFEVGEVRNRNLRLDEVVVPLGVRAGFTCAGILINQQQFTKTSHIWGVGNNQSGTNTNRIVVFQKPDRNRVSWA
jgi:hypothetical protein